MDAELCKDRTVAQAHEKNPIKKWDLNRSVRTITQKCMNNCKTLMRYRIHLHQQLQLLNQNGG